MIDGLMLAVSKTRALLLMAISIGALGVSRPARACAQETEIVRGRVLDSDKKPLAGVEVVIAGKAGASDTTKTDAKGQYTAAFRDPQGSYTISFRQVGFASFTRTAERSGLSTVVAVPDVTLAPSLSFLQPIVARADRVVPARGEVPSVGSTELTTGTSAVVRDPSDLTALMTSLIGVLPTDSGFSVLGASADQNRVLVDGAGFDGGFLPRDGITRPKLVTATFDPSKGQFAGGELVVGTRAGSELFAGIVRGQFLHPSLAWADAQSPTAVPRIGSLSGYATGPIGGRGQRLTYIFSFDVNDRTTATPSLLAPRGALLAQLGISTDTIVGVTDALTGIGVPLTSGLVPRQPGASQASGVARFDYRRSSATSISLSMIGNWRESRGDGISQLAFPSASGQSRSALARVLLNGGTYFGGVLEEFRFAWSPSSSRSAPYLDRPAGSVLTGVRFADGREGLSALYFGGAGSGTSRGHTDRFEAVNEISWLTPGFRHHVKLTQQVRVESGRTLQQSNRFGRYTYRSIEDLAANQPSSYSRTLSSSETSYRATTTAFSIGDTWHVIPGSLDVQGGFRVDATTFGPTPLYNPAVDTAFGIRTDRVPWDRGISPRLGFSWTAKGGRAGGTPAGTMILVPTGQPSTAAMGRSPADAAGISIPTPGNTLSLTGGVGAFRGMIPPTRVAALNDATGLPTNSMYVTCVGDATPIPDWTSSSGAAPDACVDGATFAPYSTVRPRVTVLDPGFRAPVSWRGDLRLVGWHVKRWSIAPRATYSVGRNGESRLPLNMRRAPAFSLAAEGHRSVFADAASIVPNTGLFAPSASQISTEFGRVTQSVSDLSYRTAQFSVAIVPPAPLFGRIPLYFAYVNTALRMEQRGFSGTTGGDPFAKETVAGSQPTHLFALGASGVRIWWFTLMTRLDVLSGFSYTPMVAQDINGDGLANDRAFIPTASAETDPTLSAELSQLLATAPDGARRCLETQAGAIAAANSCHTPWRARLDFNLGFNPPSNLGAGSRLRVTTTMLNAGGALVRLLGLERTPLGQASAATATDSRLLYVDGFDPATKRFTYRVNQLFGQPVDYGITRRRFAPFELQIGLEYRMGYPPTQQTAKTLGITSNGNDTTGARERVRTQIIRRMLGPDAVAPILAFKDSLALTADQVLDIEAVLRELNLRTDSLLAPVVEFALSRGDKLTDGELTPRIDPVGRAIGVIRAAARQKAESFLLPEQRIKLSVLRR